MLRNKIAYLLFLIGIGIYSVLYNEFFMTVIFIVFLIMPLILLILLLLISYNISLDFDTNFTVAKKGEAMHITLYFRNKSIFPISHMSVKLLYYNEYTAEKKKINLLAILEGKSSQRVSCQINSKYCGNLRFQIVSVRLYDYFSLWSVKKKMNQALSVLVVPKVYDIPEDIILLNRQVIAWGDGYYEYKAGDDPSELFDIREYREGDKLNRIHRKLSFKKDQLIIKEYSEPVNEQIIILFDWYCGLRGEEKLSYVDKSLEVILSLSYHLLEKGHMHQLGWIDEKDYKDLMLYNKEDTHVAMETLLQSRPSLYYHSVIEENYIANKYRNFTHLIYITTKVREEELDNLAKRYKGTFLYLILIHEPKKEPENSQLRQYLQELNIVLIRIDSNNIEESLRAIKI